MSPKTLISVAEFDDLLEEEFRYDLDEGKLITMTKPRARHTRVERRLVVALDAYLQNNPIGEVFSADILYVLGPATKRSPDVSVLLRPLPDPDREIQGSPEIVIEILSPSNRHVDLRRKLKQFFANDCKLAWVVDPTLRSIEIWESAAGPTRTLHENERLETALLPGFSLLIAKLF